MGDGDASELIYTTQNKTLLMGWYFIYMLQMLRRRYQ